MIYAITTTVIIFILLAVLIKVKRDEDTLTGRLTKLKTHIKHWEGRYESLSKAYEQSVAEIEDLRGTVDTFEKWIEREKDQEVLSDIAKYRRPITWVPKGGVGRD